MRCMITVIMILSLSGDVLLYIHDVLWMLCERPVDWDGCSCFERLSNRVANEPPTEVIKFLLTSFQSSESDMLQNTSQSPHCLCTAALSSPFSWWISWSKSTTHKHEQTGMTYSWWYYLLIHIVCVSYCIRVIMNRLLTLMNLVLTSIFTFSTPNSLGGHSWYWDLR